MSLLGNNVYANPNTPLWGSGGGGGGSNATFETITINQGGSITLGSSINEGTSLVFNKDLSGTTFAYLTMEYSPNSGQPADLHPILLNDQNEADMLQVGDLQAYGLNENPFSATEVISLGTAGTGTLGLRLLNPQTGSNLSTFATFASNAMDLSNVSSINGVPYFNAPGTNFQYTNWSNVPLAEAPDFSVLNSLSFTPPVNGKVYVETLGTYIGTITGGTCLMTLAVGGNTITEEPTRTQAYDSNINFTNTYMYQFPVNAGVVYDICSIAHCSALPPASADVLVGSSRMFLMFSPQ